MLSVQVLLNHHAEINARDKVRTKKLDEDSRINIRYDQDGYTALHIVNMKGHKPAVEILLNHEADVNARNKVRHTSKYITDVQGRRLLYFIISIHCCVRICSTSLSNGLMLVGLNGASCGQLS